MSERVVRAYVVTVDTACYPGDGQLCVLAVHTSRDRAEDHKSRAQAWQDDHPRRRPIRDVPREQVAAFAGREGACLDAWIASAGADAQIPFVWPDELRNPWAPDVSANDCALFDCYEAPLNQQE